MSSFEAPRRRLAPQGDGGGGAASPPASSISATFCPPPKFEVRCGGRVGAAVQTEQRNSLRLLQWMMAASLALPVALFAFASAVSWNSTRDGADRQIERTLDVAHEHALKVFETIDRSLSEINEIIRGIPDAGIRSREEALHLRLKQLAESLPQMKSAWIFDAQGHALVNSLAFPAPSIDFSDRDYFKAHIAGEIGIYIGGSPPPA